MYFCSGLAGLPMPNQFAGGFVRIAPSVQARRVGKRGGRIVPRRVLGFDANAAARSVYLKPMQLAGLGRMTPEQETQKKAIKQAWKAERLSVLAATKGQGKKARKAALIAAGVSKKDWRQTGKMLKQSYKLGVDPLAPVTPGTSQPVTSPGGSGIVDLFVAPASTGGGGGGGGDAAPMDYGDGGGGAAPAGGGILPLALAAAGVYFLA